MFHFFLDPDRTLHTSKITMGAAKSSKHENVSLW